jgi:hypothetical protein
MKNSKPLVENIEQFKDYDLGTFEDFMKDAHKAKQGKIEFDSNLRFFIKMSKPTDDKKEWITVYVKYEMQKFSLYAGVTEEPLPFFGELSKHFIEIPDEFADEVKTNETFIRALKIRLQQRLVSQDLDKINPTYYDKVFEILDRKGLSTERNNVIARATKEDAIASAKAHANHIKIIDAVKKYGANQVWGWYSERYRKFGPSHEDDYNGSGETSFEEVATKLCKSEADVKKLASQPVGFRIKYEDPKYSTYTIYIREK